MKHLNTFLLFTFCLINMVQAQVTTVANLPGGWAIGAALKGSNLYVGDANTGKIFKIDLTQPLPVPATTVLSGLASPTGLLVEGDYLYFNVAAPNPAIGMTRTGRINLNNPAPVIEQVTTNESNAEGFAQDGDTLYIATVEGIFWVNLSKPFPQPGVLVVNQPASGIAIRGNEMYYGFYNGDNVSKINLLVPNPTPEVVVSGLKAPDGVTFSGNFLYISEFTGGRIVKIDVTQPNPTVETVASGLSGPSLTIFDGLSIYFGQSNGNVSRLTINALSFSPPAPVCVFESAGQRTGGSPLGGVYSGAFVTDNGDGQTFSFNGQAAGVGSHTVTYTFGNLTATATITVGGTLATVSATSTNITCNGLSNGSATASGSAGVSYFWSNGLTTASISNLAAGTYTVTATNEGGCSATATTIITDPPVLDVVATATSNTGSNNGTATVSVMGGTGSYTYFWSNSGTTATITGLAPGTYTATVTDANGCTQTATATVQQQSILPGEGCSNALNINSLFGNTIGLPLVSSPYDNTGTNSDNDPSVDHATCFFESDSLQHTLWFNFTGNGNRYRIRTVRGAATNYILNGDTQAALFSGTCTNPVFELCQEDEDSDNNIYNLSFEVTTTNGQEYSLLVDGWDSAQGQFCMEVTRINNVNVIDIDKTSITLTPNPTAGIVNLSNVKADKILVFNSIGQLVHHFIQPDNTIDLSGQAVGLYYLQIWEGKALYSARIMKN